MTIDGTELAISLLEPDRKYYPGDVVLGVVNILTEKSSIKRSIVLELEGIVRTACKSEELSTLTIGLKGATRHPNIDQKESDATAIHHFGSSTYEGDSKAQIQYQLHVILKKGWLKRLKASHPVKIWERIDVDVPELHLPMEKYKQLHNPSGVIEAMIRVPRRGFCPDDVVPIELHINHYTRPKGPLTVYFYVLQKICREAKGYIMTENRVTATASSFLILDPDTLRLDLPLLFPLQSLVNPNTKTDLLTISSKLKIQIKLSEEESSEKIKMTFPIVIGTYNSGGLRWRTVDTLPLYEPAPPYSADR
ncbi:hypothetical protein K493DRAFT_308593 [Basidiobolus meristosporus CBS 931.73]|uniref:Arrestin C-terminal-like domain-containing protein n=1 Tax=Basidiobolus meristosporus CBS 931.73 TaxID=1314790 RepID=A0A1Y1X099_9FUNG|nr:hypothetical protein K493DRAFT_308593 [Basidiobolus meristosporus CBS 931.73]|eukprot:ORX79028.1 hypothetical protein K493DRAFT_308593 [Basidiobolus meristosporus CBS 931.73]